MKIKEWKYDDMMKKITCYGDRWQAIDVKRSSELGTAVVEDGYVTIENRIEVIKETAKAVQVKIADTWTEWFPKSAIVF